MYHSQRRRSNVHTIIEVTILIVLLFCLLCSVCYGYNEELRYYILERVEELEPDGLGYEVWERIPESEYGVIPPSHYVTFDRLYEVEHDREN